MATVIIAKNNGASNVGIEDLGIVISPSSQRDLTETFTVYEIQSSLDLKAKVTSEDIVINDGTYDLSAGEGLSHITYQTKWEDHYDELFETGPTPPDPPYDGQPWYHNGNVYYWDEIRQKWLTEPRGPFVFNSDKAKGIYLKIGSIANAVAAYYMSATGTIVGIHCISGLGDNYKTFYLRDGSQEDINLVSFSYNGSLEYISCDVNTDVNLGTKLKCWVDVSGDNVEDTVCQVCVSWRYVP